MDTDTIAESFNADGYVIVPKLFSADEIAELEAELAAHIRDVVPGHPPHFSTGVYSAATGGRVCPGASDWHGSIDSVIDYVQAPEPATLLLISLGGMAALLRRRRA